MFEEYYLYRAEDHGYHECRVPALLTTDKGTVLAFNEDYSHVIYSDDDEACWQIGGSADRGANELTAVETAKGWLYVNSSNQSPPTPCGASFHRQISWSDDGGVSFSPRVAAAALPEPICLASVCRYSLAGDGGGRNRILFSNPANAERGRRHHLTLARSLRYEECRSWPICRVLCVEPASYSDLSVVPDGTTCCLYEKGQEKEVSYYSGDIAFARFDLEWLTGGQDRL